MKLSEPITAAGKELTEITLRKPVGKDVRKCGHIFIWQTVADGKQVRELNIPAIANYIGQLSDPQLTPSAVDKLALEDFMELSGEVVSFFMAPTPESSSSDTTS